MQKVFTQAAELEKLSKEKFSIPPFLLMENAARKMADFIISKNPESVLILCGKGNNGGDGYALARMLLDKCQVLVYCQESPNTQEAQVQYQMCIKLGVKIVTDFILPEKKPSVIVIPTKVQTAVFCVRYACARSHCTARKREIGSEIIATSRD